MQLERWVTVDLDKGRAPILDLGVLYKGDTNPLKIGVKLVNSEGDVPVEGSAAARAVAANGLVISPLTTGQNANKAWCIVPQGAVGYPGKMEVYLRIAGTNNTAVMLYAYATVKDTGSGEPVNPGTPIPNVEELQEAASSAEAAAYAAEAMVSGIRPESYGAVGDGENDDTEALQAALYAAWSTNTPLVLGYGKTYTTTTDLYIYDRINIYGNGSTIKATAQLSADLLFYSDNDAGQFPEDKTNGHIENLILDGGGYARYCLLIWMAKGITLDNVDVTGFTTGGIYDDKGFEHFFSNIRIAGSGAVGETGLVVANTGDSRYENITTKNCETGVRNGGGGNTFVMVHSWNAGGANIPTSVMISTSRPVHCCQCYADTCAVAFDVTADVELVVEDTTILHGGDYWTGTSDPVVFRVTDATRIAGIQSFGMQYLTPSNSYNLFDVEPNNQVFDWFGNNATSIEEMGNLPTRSHAEGFSTEATGAGSHAEGFLTQATGIGGHVEGYGSEAAGQYSHAEGAGTIASGTSSHAEGDNTIANHKAQHVFGEYNIEDPSTAAASARGNYVEIVGNGTDTNHSNARTLDWSGNESLAGSLTLGMGTANPVTITAAQLAPLLEIATVADTESYLGL